MPQVARRLADMLIQRELALAEINPLFVSPGGCVAGDAKLVVDLGAVEHQQRIAALIEARPQTYPDANRKLAEGFDCVDIDPEGEIGLVTTGAGLSMMMIDELTARGMKPLNFYDIHAGQDAWQPGAGDARAGVDHGASVVACPLVSVFAEHHRPGRVRGPARDGDGADNEGLHVPVVARLVGRGAAERGVSWRNANPTCSSPRTWKRRW